MAAQEENAPNGPLSQHHVAANNTRDVSSFLIDTDDDECPDFSLHMAAFLGNVEKIEEILGNPDNNSLLSAKIRPFMSTPLRLAATAGHPEAIQALVDHGAQIDDLDVKAQTPLFVALVNQHWAAARVLLENGANPNGSMKNLCSPLSILCQRGFEEGIKLLCEFGVDTEDKMRLLSDMPGLPITICATYHHLRSFTTLLLNGALPDLTHSRIVAEDYMNSQCSVPHTVIKYKCPPEFLYLYREFGGNLKLRDAQGQTASDIGSECPALQYLNSVQDIPLSLASQARLAVRRAFKNRLHAIEQLDIPHKLKDILLFHYVNPQDFDVDNPAQTATYRQILETCKTVQIIHKNKKANLWQSFVDDQIDMAMDDSCMMNTKSAENSPSQPVGAGPPPPPPPPAPAPPRPKLFRYPGAEGIKRNHFNGYQN